MKEFLTNLARGRIYWLGLLLLGLFLQATALYYQYVLDEWPCVLCIHVRIWVTAFILIAAVAFFCTGSIAATRLCHGLTTGVMLGLLERSWQLLAVERGWVFGDCDLELGMPPWFALDKWLPSVFEVKTSCGYTPLILFNISMAEVLLVMSAALLLASAALFVASWFNRT